MEFLLELLNKNVVWVMRAHLLLQTVNRRMRMQSRNAFMHIEGHNTNPILQLVNLAGMHFDGVPWRNKSPIPQALGTAYIYCRSMPVLAILRLN
jgi:hypothetical protein